MELRVLQYFLAIAREETISGAAQQLHITQPTLSRQIKELEDELGKTLFVRSNKKITLTEEGMILRQRAEEIVNLVDKTELEIMSTDSHLKGEIYIGSGESHALKIITKAIKKIQAQYPDIQFHIHSGNAPDVIEKLDNGLIDFALLTPNAKINDYNHMLLPLSHHWGVLMLKDDPLAQKVYAASDIFLMPSKFEPCGLGQMIAMRYGSLPLVRETGGLKDTVKPYNIYTGEGTGFSFTNYNAHNFKDVMFLAMMTYQDKESWHALVKRAMEQDFSWNASAKSYIELYKKLM